ncbi:hypothetical protein Peur_013736 [Populus x canadensis]
MDQYEHKNICFTCKVSITEYDLNKDWWYESWPNCNKTLSRTSDNLKFNCIVTDEKDVKNFLLSGKPAENFLEALTNHFVYNKNFTDPYVVPP